MLLMKKMKKNIQDGKPERILTVSGDGTWAKRGFKSLLGVVTLIGTNRENSGSDCQEQL